MKTFKIRVTQNLTGYYVGDLEIEADSLIEAREKLGNLSNDDIDDMVDWSHGDEYEGDVSSIEFIGDLYNEDDEQI